MLGRVLEILDDDKPLPPEPPARRRLIGEPVGRPERACAVRSGDRHVHGPGLLGCRARCRDRPVAVDGEPGCRRGAEGHVGRPERLTPEIVTTVPPPTLPDAGEIFVTTGSRVLAACTAPIAQP